MHPMATVSAVGDLETFQGAVQERGCHHFVAADFTPLVKTLDQGPKSTAPVTPVDVLEEGVPICVSYLQDIIRKTRSPRCCGTGTAGLPVSPRFPGAGATPCEHALDG